MIPTCACRMLPSKISSLVRHGFSWCPLVQIIPLPLAPETGRGQFDLDTFMITRENMLQLARSQLSAIDTAERLSVKSETRQGRGAMKQWTMASLPTRLCCCLFYRFIS